MLLHTSYLCPLKTTPHKKELISTHCFFNTADFSHLGLFYRPACKKKKKKALIFVLADRNVSYWRYVLGRGDQKVVKQRSDLLELIGWHADTTSGRRQVYSCGRTLNLRSQPTTNEPSAACIFTCKHRSVFRFCYVCMEHIVYDVPSTVRCIGFWKQGALIGTPIG